MLFKIGEWEISVFVSDYFRLDGGAMFGSVPKTLWEKTVQADSENRIPLACRLLVARSGAKVVLFDVGIGNTLSEKENRIYALENQRILAADKPCTEVTDVILTHLHFDHASGISYRNGEGRFCPRFPDAKIYLQSANWERAQNPGPRERASYMPAMIETLRTSRIQLTEDGEEILPGMRVFRADGHTKGLQWITIEGEENTLAYVSDLIPTSNHIHIPYVMGYDLNAELSMQEKQSFLEKASENQWIVVFEHDAKLAAGKVKKNEKGKYALAETLNLPILESL